ncbi:tRNA (adenosine(37)-N6)-threonylcarbamoyltransferase complex ATPase subunit type 1 TsaE [Candidatus Woesebacteria bacterium RIFCSPHIGHO2_01_FULL_44_21]|uniref:tRNA threonylcarbamoyladenosine biosynthesis protein TsaE n=1 Tax=Candidatus Woesebacteria bacterium RIFCSPHIGHO2_01_FULL_44_21 TaxID=1802503 RepID=A0A1F7YWL1_9BACT|nr:MAG: tRNA (adenosine(37)-N6)-threonylcarbamoyltransferase complex ATPase subunit type 1 TsaE [Candidatus Woesebacteria bacterium RIFCSPHIGHO2_01_FULL_44_21]OGM71342.1 MAG: tRNA (adenosine(37)-N6)-threonylcarbamoyltransferase complex ATPase subunit type 1 TsaE [Candidatus Woesebacteria bacterium RIFCSPLOWO2_01_FULL_44_24b]
MEIITNSSSATKEVGREFSADLKAGDVVGLTGELGSGKTTFIQGVAEGLKIDARVNSPTFIIMREYGKLCHVDLYRLEQNLKVEMANLGLLDIIAARKSIVLIEWAERIADLLPKTTKWVNFENINENERKIKIQE